MGQTKTSFTYKIENFEQIQTEIQNWFGTVASPKLEAQRERVFKAAFAESEKKNGKLLETCDEGTKCRKTIIDELKIEISAAW